MKTDATLTRLLQEMPALTADLEGRLHGGFCAFCDTDSCEEITKANADCNCNCNCLGEPNDSHYKAQTGFTLSF